VTDESKYTGSMVENERKKYCGYTKAIINRIYWLQQIRGFKSNCNEQILYHATLV